jgi:hypothetical protein
VRLELAGFAPDLDPETPGILTDCANIIPTAQKTLSAANSLVLAIPGELYYLTTEALEELLTEDGDFLIDEGFPALTADPTGAFVGKLLDGSKRVIVGTSSELLEVTDAGYTDRSAVGGYTGTNRWDFAVFGNNILATNKSEAIQQAAPSADFAAIATAPKAAIMDIASGFVMALDYDNGTDTPDGWFCSGLFDQTIWTPSVATQCANGRLVDTPGRFTAGKALGSDFVAYKAESMYLGRYVGPPVIWSWQRVPGQIGCVGKNAVIVAENRHYFIGASDFYVYDGSVPVPIGEPVREWFFGRLNTANRSLIWGVADEARGLIYWYYPTETDALEDCIVYNYRTNRWGRFVQAIQAPLAYSSGQITYDGLGDVFATYETLPDISYDSPFWLADTTVPAVFVDRVLYQLTGTPTTSYYVTGDFGDLTNYQMLRRVTPRYRLAASIASGTNFYRDSLGVERTQDVTQAQSRRRFDFRRASRWHSFRADHEGAMVINGLDIELIGNSKE